MEVFPGPRPPADDSAAFVEKAAQFGNYGLIFLRVPLSYALEEPADERRDRGSVLNGIPTRLLQQLTIDGHGHIGHVAPLPWGLTPHNESIPAKVNTTTVLSANVLGEGLLTPPLPGPT
ncbi:MAG: hypothetical protein COZ57_27670, partial [Armatimonadetes bacterium CG_4_8_14_3_um_filter_66_20]